MHLPCRMKRFRAPGSMLTTPENRAPPLTGVGVRRESDSATIRNMVSFTAKYTKIDSGYMGQLIEWPEVVTEGADTPRTREE